MSLKIGIFNDAAVKHSALFIPINCLKDVYRKCFYILKIKYHNKKNFSKIQIKKSTINYVIYPNLISRMKVPSLRWFFLKIIN